VDLKSYRLRCYAPKRLLAVTVAMAILNLTAFAGVTRTRFFVATLMVEIVVVLASYAVLWFFWRGKNWARLCVLVVSVGSIVNFLSLIYPHGNVFVFDSIVVGWGVVGLYLLYWLNRPDIKRWFRSPGKSTNSTGT